MLNNSTQAVSVGRNQQALAFLELRNDDIIPIRQRSLNGQLKGFKHWHVSWLLGVSRILHNSIVVCMVLLHGWRRYIKTSSPNLNLWQMLIFYNVSYFILKLHCAYYIMNFFTAVLKSPYKNVLYYNIIIVRL